MADADRVDRLRRAHPPHLVFDDQLQRRIGVEPVRAGPVRHDEAGVNKLLRRRLRMLGEPLPHFDAAGIIFGGKVDIHGCHPPRVYDAGANSAGASNEARRAARRSAASTGAPATRRMTALVIARPVSQPSDVVASKSR